MSNIYTAKKWISIFFVCAFLISALTMSVSAYDIEDQSLLKDKVRPVSYSRQIRNSSLDILIEIVNSLDYPITMNATLAFPEEYSSSFSNYSHIKNSAYFKAGFRGVVGSKTYLSNHSSGQSWFKFPINGSFPECDYYVLNISWSTINFHQNLIIPKLAYTQTFNITLFEAESLNPNQRIGPSYDLRITSVTLSSSISYKGDSVLAYVTVHNYGTRWMKAFLNAEVSEDSNLYIGFDRGVEAYYGNGVDMIYYVFPGYSFTYYFAFGPILYDDSRGIWALNGRLDPVTFDYDSIWYNLDSVTLRGYGDWAFRTTYVYSTSETFRVNQHYSTPRILGAVVDDETTSIDPATFYEEVVDYPIRIGEGDNLEPYTTFEEEFGVDFRFTSVGYYDWDNVLHGYASRSEALQNTAHALGMNLKLGGNWISKPVDHPTNSDYSYGYTQRENHGFDIGLGFMSAGFVFHRGEGLAIYDGSIAVTIGTQFMGYTRVQEAGLHELSHLFAARHGDDDYFGSNKFGLNFDGFTYIQANGTGHDLLPLVGWRMHTLTRQLINGNYHLRKFDGALPPEYTSSMWYGQKDCYVNMGANQPTSPVYVLSSDGYYRWTYNSQHYDRFTVTNSYDLDVEQDDRYLSSKKVSANIDYYGSGSGAFYVGYQFYWLSTYYPTGFSPSQGLDFSMRFWLYEEASSTISSVDNVQIRIVSHQSSIPQVYYTAGFKASSPPSPWLFCHNTWAEQRLDEQNGPTLYDSTVYVLFGVYDAWTYDWSQNIKVHPVDFTFKYTLSSW